LQLYDHRIEVSPEFSVRVLDFILYVTHSEKHDTCKYVFLNHTTNYVYCILSEILNCLLTSDMVISWDYCLKDVTATHLQTTQRTVSFTKSTYLKK